MEYFNKILNLNHIWIKIKTILSFGSSFIVRSKLHLWIKWIFGSKPIFSSVLVQFINRIFWINFTIESNCMFCSNCIFASNCIFDSTYSFGFNCFFICITLYFQWRIVESNCDQNFWMKIEVSFNNLTYKSIK